MLWSGGLAAVATAQIAGGSVDEARQLLTQGRFIEALAAAQDAQRADPQNYQAFYYVAMAQMGLRQYDAAEAGAAAALRLAPESARAAVEKLAETIRSLRQGTSNVAEADAALNEGLIGKAARLYELAWQAGRNAPDYAFKAAGLYATRLNQPVDAARVLRDVRTARAGSADADKAAAELQAIAPTLRSIAEAQVKGAARLPFDQAEAKLREAEDADPDYPETYRLRARLAAASGSVEATKSALKALARRNLLTTDDVANLPGLHGFAAEPAFANFLADVIGTDQAAVAIRRASPAGKIDYLNQLARNGGLQMFFGARRNDAGNFRFYARRTVSALRDSAPCQTSVGFGTMVESSGNVGDFPHVIEWRRTTAPATNGNYIGIGPTPSGWQSVGFNTKDDAAQAGVLDAVRVLRAECPAPPPKR